MKNITTLVLLVFQITSSLGQEIKLSSEKILEINQVENFPDKYLFYPIGYTNENPVYIFKDVRTRSRTLYKLNESSEIKTDELKEYDKEVNKYLTSHNILNELLFYSKYFLDSPEIFGHSKLYLTNKNTTLFLDSIYNADKLIHSSFSTDGRYLLVNTLNTLSDYYNPEQDNRIMVYDLNELDQGKIKKEYIPCTHCSDSYLVSDQLFFTIGRKDGYDGFSNKDIYVAPWSNLSDSVKIASNTNILAISPDGKYILGTRFFDLQKTTAIIIDVENKKYQLLLGRDYAAHRAFYSYHEEKFAFDFKGFLIYVTFPENYPFDALKWRNEEIPDWTEEDFWNKYVHEPLPED